MLEKDEESMTKHDCAEITNYLDQTDFIKRRSEDVTVNKDIAFNEIDKLVLYKKATYKKFEKGEYVYKRK